MTLRKGILPAISNDLNRLLRMVLATIIPVTDRVNCHLLVQFPVSQDINRPMAIVTYQPGASSVQNLSPRHQLLNLIHAGLHSYPIKKKRNTELLVNVSDVVN